MATAKNSVTIRRPVAEVFRFVADGENGPKWRGGIVDIARVHGDGGTGTVYRQGVRGPMGRRIAADYELTSVVPNRALEFRAIAGPVRPHGRYDFEAADGGTCLSFTLHAELHGLRKLLIESMVAKTMAAEVGSLEKLKRVLES
jgi:uncharacterized protein YndB with AHSA1/START domain